MTIQPSSLRRRAFASFAAAAVLFTGPVAGAARADDKQAVTSATAEVTRDNQYRFDDAFRIVESEGDVVDAANYAYAHAKGCEGCTAVALSFQIVLVQEPPETVTPENAAVALNELCDSCDAAAGAYQFVVGGQPVRLTGSGRQQLDDVRKQVDALRTSGLSGPAMVAQADALADQVRSILKTELRSTDENGHGDGKAKVDERRTHEDGPDGRSDDAQTYQIDD